MEDFYDLLGVSEDAPTEEIDRAWRERARTYHPDVNDDARANAQFKTLKAAHEVLSAEEKRAAYDRMGHETYVRERLGGLPTAGQPGPNATGEGGDPDDTPDGERGSEADRSADATGHRAGPSERTGSSRRSRATEAEGASRSTASAGQSRSAGASGRTASSETAASASTASSGSATGRRSAASTSRLRFTRLQYGWVGVLLAGAVYLAGLRQYLGANAAAIGALREAVAADPVDALTASRLLPPGTFALHAASGGLGPDLLFPVGVVALAVAFLAVVVSFGRGSAYLYLLGGLSPPVGLAVGPVFALPDGAVLALVAALPVGATFLFAIDVGRYAVR